MRALLGALLAAACGAAPAATPYHEQPAVRAFIRDMVERNGFVEKELVYLFSHARRQEGALLAIEPQPPAERSWREYRATFVNAQRIERGRQFWRQHRAALARAER